MRGVVGSVAPVGGEGTVTLKRGREWSGVWGKRREVLKCGKRQVVLKFGKRVVSNVKNNGMFSNVVNGLFSNSVNESFSNVVNDRKFSNVLNDGLF